MEHFPASASSRLNVAGKIWASLGRWLVEPTSRITDPVKRRKARLLSFFLICLFLLFLGVNFSYLVTVPDYQFPVADLIGYVVLIITYIISRTRLTGLAVIVLLIMFPMNVFQNILSGTSLVMSVTLAYLLPSYILASIFLSTFWMALFGYGTNLIVFLLPFLAPNLVHGITDVLGPLAVGLISVTLLVIAIENRNRIERDRQSKLQLQIKILTALNGITSAGAKATDMDVLIERATGILGEMLYPDNCGILLVDDATGTWQPHPSYRGTSAENLRRNHAFTEGIAGKVAASGKAIRVDDIRNEPAYIEATPGIQSEVCVPITVQGRVVAVLNAESRSLAAFTTDDERFLVTAADSLAIAIEKIQLVHTEGQRRREAAAIAEVGRDISATLQLDVVLDRIASYAKDLLMADTSAVYLAEPGSPFLHAIAAIGPDAEEIMHDPLETGAGILGNIALQKSGEIVNDTVSDPRAIIVKGTVMDPLEHIMGVPVLSKDRLTGLIAVWRTGIGVEFKPAELDFLNSLAQQVAVAIENARLFEETQQHLGEMQGLAHIGEAISQHFELEPLLTEILDAACETIHRAEKGSILLLEEQDTLRICAVSGYTDPRTLSVHFPVDTGYASLAVREKRGVLVPDAQADQARILNVDIPEMIAIQSAMVAPLIVNQRVIGAISLDNASKKSAFTDDDLRLLGTLAGSAALAIDNARLFKATRQRLKDLEILQAISTALRVAKTLDEALPIILDQLIKLLDGGGALLEILEPASGEIVTKLAKGTWAPVTGLRTPPGAGVSGRVISTSKAYITDNLPAEKLVVRPDLIGDLNAAACVPVIAQQRPIGVLWVGRKTSITEEEVALLTALGEMVGNTIHRMSLHEQTVNLLDTLRTSNFELNQAYETTLEGWARALELRDKSTEGHTRRVAELTLRLAGTMGIPEEELVNIHRGVLLHDIGKMAVPDQILKKTGTLLETEWNEMRQHPQYAYNMLAPIAYLHAAIDIPYCHHEHWDGSGYPRGLKGEQIPLSARIFSVVDVWDALLSDRPYRKAWPLNEVLDYVQESAGTLLDPVIVDRFLKMIREDPELVKQYHLNEQP